MHKLAAVEEARVLMREGQNWGVWKWLMEKSTVREAADRATAALAESARKAKRAWSDDLRNAYKQVAAEADIEQGKRGTKRKSDLDPKTKAAMQRVKEADDEAQQATVDAEEMFAEAERRMSAGMAREAAQKALVSYDLREKAIRKAEAAGRTFST